MKSAGANSGPGTDGVPRSRFDHEDYPPAERLAEFRTLTASVFEIWASGAAEDFRVNAEGYRVGDLIFNRVAYSAARFVRDARHLRGETRDFLVLQYQHAGRELLLMDGGTIRLEAGNLYLRDWSFPFDSQATEMRLDSVVIPRHRLRSSAILNAALPVLTWPAESPEGQMLASNWSSLIDFLPGLTLRRAEVLAEAFLGFIDGLLGYGASARPDKTLGAMEQFLLVRLRGDVGTDDLCLAFNVSRSQVFRLFSPHGGVKAFIKRRRLEHCYRDLLHADPERTRVGDVAYSWGFHDASMFSRQFRAEFGQSPSAVLGQVFDAPARIRRELEDVPMSSRSYGRYLRWLRRAAQSMDVPGGG